jgi:hypothetical protein
MWFLVNFLKFSRWIVEEEEKEKTLEDEKLLHHIEQVHWGMSSGEMVEAGKLVPPTGGWNTHRVHRSLACQKVVWPSQKLWPSGFGRLM